MNPLREYASQTIIASLQVVAVIWGVWGVTTVVNTLSYGGDERVYMGSTAAFVRGWGFFFLLIPVSWIVATVRAEERVEWFSKRWTVATGFILLLALVWFFSSAAGRLIGKVTTGFSND